MISTVLSYGIDSVGVTAELPVKSNKLIRYCRSVVLLGGQKEDISKLFTKRMSGTISITNIYHRILYISRWAYVENQPGKQGILA